MRSNPDSHRSHNHSSSSRHDGDDEPSMKAAPGSLATAMQQQQQKTRRRRGSLRKVALLGRGAARERRDSKSSDAKKVDIAQRDGSPPTSVPAAALADIDTLGLGISDITPRPSMDGYASRSSSSAPSLPPPLVVQPLGSSTTSEGSELPATSPTISYSTTDEEDALHMGGAPQSGQDQPRPGLLSSGSESYFGNGGAAAGRVPLQRRRSDQRAKSPLSLSNLATPMTAGSEGDWDYSETEWWGWVVLVVTWLVFVVGMGSCFGVWSWAWDVGTTPYAPPELEDDPTLPIVGYYPALIILTCVMAWVWVVIAWIGMKYFRHARMSGD